MLPHNLVYAAILASFASLAGCASSGTDESPAGTLPEQGGATAQAPNSAPNPTSTKSQEAGGTTGGNNTGTGGTGTDGGGTGSGPTAASASCTTGSFTGTLTLTPNAGGDHWDSATLKIVGPKHLDKNDAQIWMELEDLDRGGRSATPILDTTDDFPSDGQEHPISNWNTVQADLRTRGIANFNGNVKLRFYAVIAFDKDGPDPHCTTDKIE